MKSIKIKKKVPWYGWKKIAPFGDSRIKMYIKFGNKCFLGSRKLINKKYPNFPICTKGTCTINKKGLYAAYIRAKQWSTKSKFKKKTYKKIALLAKDMLNKYL